MEDTQIIDLYWQRSEQAIAETDGKYGGYCYSIAYNILTNNEDAEESVSDTYMAAWNTMPPRKPAILATFLGKITRRLSIDRWRERHSSKRGGGELPLALDELEDCVAGRETVELTYERKRFARAFNGFLDALPETERRVFLCRYWYLDPIGQIAAKFGFTESKVASMLHRTRKKLRATLEQEGLYEFA